MYEYYDKYDDYEPKIKGRNRDRKIDKRERDRQDFMKINGQGLKKDILPLLEKRARESRKDK